MSSFEGTAIFDEALRETFTKDLDLSRIIMVLNRIRNGGITIEKLETHGIIAPVSRVGIERASMKTDLIPSEGMRLILIESAKVRLLNEIRTFVCTNCWNFSEMMRMKDLPDKPACPRCGSYFLGVLNREENEVQLLMEKKGKKLARLEQKLYGQALETAQLMSQYGKPAAAALSGRRLKTSDAKVILSQERRLSNHFFGLVVEAERNALKRRFL